MRSCRRQSEAEQMKMKKKEIDHFTLLSDDLLLEILKRLQPDMARFVCWRWFLLINNKILSDHTCLILEKQTGRNTLRLMDMREEKHGVKTKEQHLNIFYTGRIKSWCNECLLIIDQNKGGRLYIYNLLTKVKTFLPRCSTSCGGHKRCKCGVGLSYDEVKGVYKVVHVFMGPQIQSELLVYETNAIPHCSNWKRIDGPFYTGERKYYWNDPVTVRGRYFHWDVHSSEYLVSMDTVEERFCQTCLPGSDDYRMDDRYSLAEMSGSLALLHKTSFEKFSIWILKSFKRSKWEKFWSTRVWSFVCSSFYPWSDVPFPLTSVRSKRFIIFRKSKPEPGLYSYDLQNKITIKLEIDIAGDERCVVHSTTRSYS